MKRSMILSTVVVLAVAAVALGYTNLNSSKSNAYRVTWSADLANKEQIAALLTELEKIRPAGEAALKQWLPRNVRRFGIDPARIKKLVIMLPDKELKETAILLLTNPSDEAAARITTVKSSKSNSSE